MSYISHDGTKFVVVLLHSEQFYETLHWVRSDTTLNWGLSLWFVKKQVLNKLKACHRKKLLFAIQLQSYKIIYSYGFGELISMTTS